MTKKRTLTVKGKGFASTPPDHVQVDIHLSGTKETFEESMNNSSERLERLRKELDKLHFEKKDIKTAAFHIEPEYTYPSTQGDNQERKFTGFRYQHHLHIEFQNDSELLGKVLQNLVNSGAEPEFSVRFKLKNKTQIQKMILEDAVRDAKDKAQILAKTSGVKLDSIQSIQYEWEKIELYSTTEFLPQQHMMRSESLVLDWEPEDITNSDTVTIVWELEEE